MYVWYTIVQYYVVHEYKRHFELKNEFLNPKNHG